MFVENSNVLLSKESAHIMTPRQRQEGDREVHRKKEGDREVHRKKHKSVGPQARV